MDKLIQLISNYVRLLLFVQDTMRELQEVTDEEAENFPWMDWKDDWCDKARHLLKPIRKG